MSLPQPNSFDLWYRALRGRYVPLASLPDIRKGVQALSTLWVERRSRLEGTRALDGPSKRAAFALYYGPLHFLTVREVVRALEAASPPPRAILDLGCGTGAAGAAWALASDPPSRLDGVDRSAWAVGEAVWTLRTLGLRGSIRRGEAEGARLPAKGCGILAAWAVNELDDPARGRLLDRLLGAAERGARILIVEPISRAVTPWWDSWADAFRGRGGRSDDWRFEAELPPEIEELDRAAGLDHRELTARSLWLPAP